MLMLTINSISSRETCRQTSFIKLLGNGRVEGFIFYTTPLPKCRGFLFMKKYIAVILSLVLCVCFFSCGKVSVPEESVNASGEMSNTTENTDTHSEHETESVTESVSESNREESRREENSSKESSREESSKAKPSGNSETETKNTTSHSETTDAPTVTSTEKPTEPSSKIVCTVQAECKQILSKKNKFKKDIALVPTDGVILAPVKVYLDDGATAYDALKKACNENGLELKEEKSAFGVYIVGIGGIDEKDCGAQSGWTYTVNGQSPSVGLGNYKIKNGDSLVLSYVC